MGGVGLGMQHWSQPPRGDAHLERSGQNMPPTYSGISYPTTLSSRACFPLSAIHTEHVLSHCTENEFEWSEVDTHPANRIAGDFFASQRQPANIPDLNCPHVAIYALREFHIASHSASATVDAPSASRASSSVTHTLRQPLRESKQVIRTKLAPALPDLPSLLLESGRCLKFSFGFPGSLSLRRLVNHGSQQLDCNQCIFLLTIRKSLIV